MAEELDDLEDLWQDLRGSAVTRVDPNTTEGVFAIAKAETLGDIRSKYGQAIDAEDLTGAANDVIERFSRHLLEGFRKRGTSGLIEMILMDTTLPVATIKGFVRALPADVIRQICEEGAIAPEARGVHALLSFERLYRLNPANFREDYSVARAGDGVLEVRVVPSSRRAPFVFRLDDRFDMTTASNYISEPISNTTQTASVNSQEDFIT